MDIKINSNLSNNTNVEFLCIEYPGVVVNVNKMLATLGGPQHIAEVHGDTAKRLDLKFRPDDPCCKPLCADKIPCTSLLLKVSKYKRKNCSEKEEFVYRQNICGIVKSIYKFNSLCDYQYLPLKKDNATGDFKNMIPYLKIDESVVQNSSYFTQDVPLFLPPPTYGRLDTPHTYQYKKDYTNYRKNTTRSITSWEHRISSRKDRNNHCLLVRYDGEVPTKGLPKAFEYYNATLGNLVPVKEQVQKAFDERPIWSRNALQATYGFRIQTLKNVLPLIAYYMVTGPWARLWIKFGYDPKLHSEARQYQLIDFRLRQGYRTPRIPVKAKRSSFNYKLPNLSAKHRMPTKSPASFVCNPGQQDDADNDQAGEDKRTMEPVFLYQPGVLPAHRQIYYQICDIHLPQVHELVNKSDHTDVTCNKEDGWLLPNTTAEIRNLLTKDIHKSLSMLKGDTGEDSTLDEGKAKHSELSQSEDVVADGSDQEDENASDLSTESSADEESLTGRSQDDLLTEDVLDMEGDEIEDPDDDDFEDESGLYFDDDEEQFQIIEEDDEIECAPAEEKNL